MSELKQTQKWVKPLVVTLVFLIPLLYFFSPMIFNGQRPTGVDISASKGNTNLYVKYQEESGEKVLWNPNIFAGMPVYPRITPTIIHADSFISLLGKVIYSYFLSIRAVFFCNVKIRPITGIINVVKRIFKLRGDS